MCKIDDVDKSILTALIKDGSESYQSIGKKIFVSGGTVHVRMKKLKLDEVFIKHSTEVDYAKLGYDIHAFITFNLMSNRRANKIIKELSEENGVLKIVPTTNFYLVEIVCKNISDLNNMIDRKIKTIKELFDLKVSIQLSEGIKNDFVIK
jgi:Lrp/AsnC family transcriptional regulator for asnA, asnC and gidA